VSDIDKILEEVERLRDVKVTFDASPEHARVIGKLSIAAGALAPEVRRLRAELANVERAFKESTGRTVLCRSRLVAAAVDLAHEVEGSGPSYEREIAYAYRITGIRLKFEDGRFVEDESE